jgi:lysophospholipase L1-like esterase
MKFCKTITRRIRAIAVAALAASVAPVAYAETFLLAGDSTLDDYGRKPHEPYASWGTRLEKSMKPGCKVDNYARSGASTKSFIASGQWGKLVAAVKPGDFVGIQFGHNDQKWSTPFYAEERFTDPDGLFRENVRKFVAEVRARGGKPVLMSPIVRGTFGKDGKLCDYADKKGISLGSYAKAMQELGEELRTEFVDMNRLTRDLLEKVGKDEAMKFFVISTGLVKDKDGEPAKDVTHPVAAGAEAFAKLFIDEVKARRLEVAALFR